MDSVSFYQAFPSLIYQAPLKRLVRKKTPGFSRQLLKEAYLLKEQDLAGQIWSEKNYPNGYTSYGSVDRLHQMSPTFQDLADQIRKHVAAFIKKANFELSIEDLELTTLWINIMSEGTQHSLHVHPKSVISGTYYVAMPKQKSPIKFEDPRLTKFMNRPSVKKSARPVDQNYVWLEPKVGDLILFESWMRHEVGLILGKEDRVSVSFNWNWK